MTSTKVSPPSDPFDAKSCPACGSHRSRVFGHLRRVQGMFISRRLCLEPGCSRKGRPWAYLVSCRLTEPKASALLLDLLEDYATPEELLVLTTTRVEGE